MKQLQSYTSVWEAIPPQAANQPCMNGLLRGSASRFPLDARETSPLR